VSQVEKFTLSDESYRQREGTFFKFKQAHPELFPHSAPRRLAGPHVATPEVPPPPPPPPTDPVATIPVGARCQVRGESGYCRRGVVKFVGLSRKWRMKPNICVWLQGRRNLDQVRGLASASTNPLASMTAGQLHRDA